MTLLALAVLSIPRPARRLARWLRYRRLLLRPGLRKGESIPADGTPLGDWDRARYLDILRGLEQTACEPEYDRRRSA